MARDTILFSEMTPDPSWEQEFNAWYDQEHIPERMAVPGFKSAQRYIIPESRSYLAVYELDSSAALQTPAYQQVKNNPSEQSKRIFGGVKNFTRYICEETGSWGQVPATSTALDAPLILAVFFQVPVDRESGFSEWYENEHIPMLLGCKDWLLVRRLRVTSVDPNPFTHLALHYLGSTDALKSPERAQARATPWRARLAQESWFQPSNNAFTKLGARQHAISDSPVPSSPKKAGLSPKV